MKWVKLIVTAAAIVISCIDSHAQKVERVYTKGGDVYEGYISEQVPGKYMLVYSVVSDIVITMDSTDVVLRTENRSRAEMNGFARDYVRVLGTKDTSVVSLSTLLYKGQYLDDVYIKSRDKNRLNYVSLSGKTFKIPYSDVSKTQKLYNKSVPYGLRDVILLSDGKTCKGYIDEQEGGMIRFVSSDGVKQSLSVKDVISIGVEAIDKKTGLWEQTLLYDKITLRDNTVIEGLIVNRVFGKTLTILRKSDNRETKIDIPQIVKYEKFRNDRYRPYVVDDRKYVTVNGKEARFAKITELDDACVLVNADSVKMCIPAGEKAQIVLHQVQAGESSIVYSLDYQRVNERGNDLTGEVLPRYHNSDDPYKEPVITKDGGGNIQMEIMIRKTGDYILLFSPENHIGIVLSVETKK